MQHEPVWLFMVIKGLEFIGYVVEYPPAQLTGADAVRIGFTKL
jgi:hypothetical protein